MHYTVKQLEKNTAEIKVELSPEDVQPHLEDAAGRISQNTKIPGFRPGHASYAVVEKRVGAEKIMEEALEPIVRKSYIEAVTAEKLEPVGSPNVAVGDLVVGKPLTITLTVSLLPNITKLADHTTVKVKSAAIEVKDEEIQKVLGDIQKMRAKEVRSTKPVTQTDHVVMDLAISQAGTPIEGGAAKDHHVIMNEPYYIPGFADELKGTKEGDEKAFTLEFPKEHYQKNLAGKPVEFKAKIKEVYERELPELNDVFAEGLGKKTMDEVREQLKKNILDEKQIKEDARVEQHIVDEIIKNSQFDDIPDLLVNEEIERMRHELEANAARQGLEWNNYLSHIGKTEAQLKLDFAPQAVKRVKGALVVREIAAKEEIHVSPEELDEEIDRTAELYKDDKETKERIHSPAYREQVLVAIKNRKTIARLKELAAK